jgi:hypothetical protein
MPLPLIDNVVRQAHISPFGSPSIAGNWRLGHPFGELRNGVPHNGCDFDDGECLGDVLAPMASVIDIAGIPTSAAWDYGSGGHIVRGRNGKWRWYIAHLHDDTVGVGQSVALQQLIGHCGGAPGMVGAGNSTGCHVHLTLQELVGTKWVNRDPWPHLRQNNVVVNAGANIRSAANVTAAVVAQGPQTLYTTGSVVGGPYKIAGVAGNTWTRVLLPGSSLPRFVAKPLVRPA